MKIAIVSDDKQTISRHFGRAENYIVMLLEQNQIKEQKTLPKVAKHKTERQRGRHSGQTDPRGSGFGQRAHHRHAEMFDGIRDCDVLIARGMGRGAYDGLQQLGIQPIVTDIANIEDAVQAVLDGTIINHTEKLH
jgi:predicted Fe-Mo cluster-binding NifX family protein